MKHKFISGFILGGLLFGASGVIASNNLEKISAYINHGVKFEINKVAWESPDHLAPITYKDTTYLPLRAIASAVNMEVSYNDGIVSLSNVRNVNLEPIIVNSIILGATSLDVENILGKPIKTKKIDDNMFTNEYRDVSIMFERGYEEKDKFFSGSIEIKGGNITTSRGIGIGSTKEQIVEKYGFTNNITERNSEISWAYGEGYRGLIFVLKDNKVISFRSYHYSEY
jgi:hypothetical protein